MKHAKVLGLVLGIGAVVILFFPPAGSAAELPPTVLWNVTFDAAGFDFANGSAVGADGHPVVAGLSCALDFTACDFRTIKYDALTGSILWNVTFDSGGGNNDEALDVAVGPDGHPVVTGFSCAPDSTACDFRMIKYDGATGAVLWNVAFNSGGSNMDVAVGVAVGADGHPVVAGESCAPDFTACDLRTIKYDGATGGILWNVTFDSGGDDEGGRVAIGGDGHPIVTGFSCATFFTACNFRTIKYDGGAGATLWNVTFDSGGEDLAFAIGVGSDGHAVVGGETCSGAFTACDLRAIKYNGGTGAVLWNVTFNSGGANSDEVDGIKVGADGHPVLAGLSCTPGFPNCDFRTMKLDGATGATLWNVTFTGAGDHDAAFGVAAGIDGNPAVTGISCANYPVCDFRTIKYLLQYDTPSGSNVAVAVNGGTGAADGVSVSYASVTTAGSTTVTTSTTGPMPPAGFNFGTPPTYYDVATTAAAGGPIVVCVNYTNRPFALPESDLKLFHLEGGVWVDRTTSLDTAANVICATVSSLSLFGIAHPGTLIPVTIDIKPGSFPNSVNLGSGGTVPVAVFSTVSFDATTVDPVSVTLASAPVKLKGKGTSMASFEDVNGDGRLDLVVHVETTALQLSETDTITVLEGQTFAGQAIRGTDSVRVVP